MANQLSVAVRNARLNVIESTIGTAPVLKIYDLTGAAPANCAAAIVGTVLAEITLPSDWMDAAASGSKAKLGTWQDVGVAAGNADFYRIYESTETDCHLQGTVTISGGGGDMTVNDVAIGIGNVVTVTGFTWTDGNA